MSKYIKLEDAIEQVKTEFYGGGYQEWLEISIDNLINRIANLPTIEVSEDCISREWVKGICENMLDEEMLGHMLGYIEDAPSVVSSCQKNRQVERAEGEWIFKGNSIDPIWNCSECGKQIICSRSELPNYCEDCGAKMKG